MSELAQIQEHLKATVAAIAHTDRVIEINPKSPELAAMRRSLEKRLRNLQSDLSKDKENKKMSGHNWQEGELAWTYWDAAVCDHAPIHEAISPCQILTNNKYSEAGREGELSIDECAEGLYRTRGEALSVLLNKVRDEASAFLNYEQLLIEEIAREKDKDG